MVSLNRHCPSVPSEPGAPATRSLQKPRTTVSVQSRRQFPAKHVVFSPNLCFFMLLRTILHSPKTQLLCIQSVPHSLPKTTRGGGGATVVFLKKNFNSVGITGGINVRPCPFLREPNRLIHRCYRT